MARSRRRVRAGGLLEPGERVLGESQLRDGGTALGTDRALIINAAAGCSRRIRWADIAEAAWSRARGSTVISMWPDGSGRRERLELPTDRRLASLAVDRIAAAQVLRRRVWLTERVAATVLATRASGEDVIWRVLVDGGGENNPDVANAARRVVAELRGLAGC